MSDISITAESVIPSGAAQFERRFADENITAGQTLYKLDNGKVGLFDANGAPPLCVFEGIACDTAAEGQPCVYARKDPLGLTIGATVAIGDSFWASGTPGGITKTPADVVTGWYAVHLGVAISTTQIIFNPTSAGAAKA